MHKTKSKLLENYPFCLLGAVTDPDKTICKLRHITHALCFYLAGASAGVMPARGGVCRCPFA